MPSPRSSRRGWCRSSTRCSTNASSTRWSTFPLGSLASPTRELSRGEIIQALHDAALAVHELHEHGLVHGDVKPANIMFDGTGGKLSDLGLVRTLNSESTVTSFAPAMSVEFIDPELLQGAVPSRASDILALGRHDQPRADGRGPLRRAASGSAAGGDQGRDVRTGQGVAQAQGRRGELVQACLAPAENRPPTAAAVAEALAGLK